MLHTAGVVPAIGVGAATAPGPASEPTPIGSFVRVELDLASPAWRAALDRATASGLRLDVSFVRASAPGLFEAVRALRGLHVRTVGAFAGDGPEKHLSDATTVAALREALREEGLDHPVVGGARTHFTELNRGHDLLPDDLDGVGFAATPLFHERARARGVDGGEPRRADDTGHRVGGVLRGVGARGIRSSDGEPYPVAEALGVLAGLAGVPVEVGGSARPPLGAAEYSPGRMCPAGEIASIEG
ncbi:MAG: hypothetical protein K0S70_4094 [Microbacterium sp.]|nr:hypothetical protein [Microbacterium sp.]